MPEVDDWIVPGKAPSGPAGKDDWIISGTAPIKSTAQAVAPFPTSGPGPAVPRAATLQELSVPGRDAISDPFGNLTTDPTGLIGAAKGIAYLPASIEEHRDLVKKMEQAGYTEAQVAEERKNNPAFNALFSVAAGPVASRILGPVGERLPAVPGEAALSREGRPSFISGSREVVQQAFSDLSAAIDKNDAGKAEQFIRQAYERSVRPGVKGKPEQFAAGRAHARAAIDSIIENEPNLTFIDAAGELTAGQVPQNLEQFSDAISQTKQSIYEYYDAMQRRAGLAGESVDLRPAAAELLKIANDPVVATHFPAVKAYAEAQAEALLGRGSHTMGDGQKAVQMYNKKLEAFYNNPSYETVGTAGVDAIIANQLRLGLDQAVERAVGPGYQVLKNKHGSLQAIERDVVRSAMVDARKSAGGGLVGNLMNVGSGEELLRGLLTANRTAIARSAASKAVQLIYKKLRDPNRAIRRMFEVAKKHYEAPPAPRKQFPPGLPPPTLEGPLAPWIRTPGGPIPPEAARFSTKQPPTGVTSREPVPPRRSTLTTAPEAPAPPARPALPAPPQVRQLPAPRTVSGPQPPGWTQVGQGMIPPGPPTFKMPVETPPHPVRLLTPSEYAEMLANQAGRLQ